MSIRDEPCHALRAECSVLCVLPPHILTSIIAKGSARQRERALRILGITNSLSASRIGYAEATRPERQAARAKRLLGSGAVLRGLLAGTPQRTISTANNTERSVGVPVRKESDPATGDPAVDEAYNYMGATYDFYWQVFSRDSIDNEGMPLDGTVHYGQDYDNAFWDGRRMIYGDGDGEQFDRFTKAVDVIGHELTHGVTQNEAGLIYWGQSGALNESVSDVFGSLVKQYYYNQLASQADWLIGQGLFTPAVQGVAIRSMAAPGTAYDDPVLGKDPQPAHMQDYQHTIQDNGGVHINSGIPNHAFYLAAMKLGGNAWETAGLIWYQTLLRPALSKTANFHDFARLTVFTARQLFSLGPEAQAVGDAWAEVGISV